MFSFGKKKGATVGLDINSDSTSLVLLEKNKSGIEVMRFACQPTPPNCVREGLVTDPITMGTLLAELLRDAQIPMGGQAPTINLCVPAQGVVIRLMPVPVGMPPEELADVVTQEATNHVPFPISEANLDWCQMNATERTDPDGVRRVDVILAAIQHSIVESYWRMTAVAGVKEEPVWPLDWYGWHSCRSSMLCTKDFSMIRVALQLAPPMWGSPA